MRYVIQAVPARSEWVQYLRDEIPDLVVSHDLAHDPVAPSVEHWEKRRAAMEGKAIIVTMSHCGICIDQHARPRRFHLGFSLGDEYANAR